MTHDALTGPATVAWYGRVASGDPALTDVGTGASTPGAAGVRRDGGLVEHLEAARRPDPAFVAVVCASIERISRSHHLAARVECELDRAGPTLLAADEGISPAASALVSTRHLRQAIAEWYLMPMLQRLSADDAHTDPHVSGVLREIAERTDRAQGPR